jgi:hypothetical protein
MSEPVLAAGPSDVRFDRRGAGIDAPRSRTDVVLPCRPRGERCRDMSYLPDLAGRYGFGFGDLRMGSPHPFRYLALIDPQEKVSDE